MPQPPPIRRWPARAALLTLLIGAALTACTPNPAGQGILTPQVALAPVADPGPTLRDLSRGAARALLSAPADLRRYMSHGVPVRRYLISGAVGGAAPPRALLMVHPHIHCRIDWVDTWSAPRDGGRRVHRGVDIRGLEANLGLGTPVRAMVRGRVVRLGSPQRNARRFGRADRRRGVTRRSGRRFPRSAQVEGYGKVYFFTRNAGSSGTGAMVATVAIGGELDGHKLRYIHLAAVHPDLRVGDVVEAGQELGLMGGTAVQQAWPHLHFDITNPAGVRVDPRPFLERVSWRPPRHEYCLAPPCADPARPGVSARPHQRARPGVAVARPRRALTRSAHARRDAGAARTP